MLAKNLIKRGSNRTLRLIKLLDRPDCRFPDLWRQLIDPKTRERSDTLQNYLLAVRQP